MSKKTSHNIIGVHITNRVRNVPAVQAVLTEYGCVIKTRLGLHDVAEDRCSPNGLLLVEMVCEKEKVDGFVKSLKAVEGVDVQQMTFMHD